MKVQRRGNQDSEKIKLLGSLGFVGNILDWQWDQGYQAQQDYWAREKHYAVPAKFQENGFKLGVWVGTQRTKAEQMTPERKQKLDSLGFIWDASKGKT